MLGLGLGLVSAVRSFGRPIDRQQG